MSSMYNQHCCYVHIHTPCRTLPVMLRACTLAPLQFNSVTSLSILIESNQGDEETTKVSKIALGGTAFDSFDVSNIKKVEDKQ